MLIAEKDIVKLTLNREDRETVMDGLIYKNANDCITIITLDGKEDKTNAFIDNVSFHTIEVLNKDIVSVNSSDLSFETKVWLEQLYCKIKNAEEVYKKIENLNQEYKKYLKDIIEHESKLYSIKKPLTISDLLKQLEENIVDSNLDVYKDQSVIKSYRIYDANGEKEISLCNFIVIDNDCVSFQLVVSDIRRNIPEALVYDPYDNNNEKINWDKIANKYAITTNTDIKNNLINATCIKHFNNANQVSNGCIALSSNHIIDYKLSIENYDIILNEIIVTLRKMKRDFFEKEAV